MVTSYKSWIVITKKEKKGKKRGEKRWKTRSNCQSRRPFMSLSFQFQFQSRLHRFFLLPSLSLYFFGIDSCYKWLDPSTSLTFTNVEFNLRNRLVIVSDASTLIPLSITMMLRNDWCHRDSFHGPIDSISNWITVIPRQFFYLKLTMQLVFNYKFNSFRSFLGMGINLNYNNRSRFFESESVGYVHRQLNRPMMSNIRSKFLRSDGLIRGFRGWFHFNRLIRPSIQFGFDPVARPDLCNQSSDSLVPPDGAVE